MTIDRRSFIELTGAGAVALGLGCASPGTEPDPGVGDGDGDGDLEIDAAPEIDPDAADPGPDCPTATYRDTYAVALYFDGTIGPLTGVISADYR